MKNPRIPPREMLDRSAEELQSLSLDERGELIIAACESAAMIAESRKRMGLPPVEPAPWPESTLEFFRRHSPNGRSE